jgi:hypothetical protein
LAVRLRLTTLSSEHAEIPRISTRSRSKFELMTDTPNQSLERTADRRDNLLAMTSTLNPEAQLAVVSGRSSFSR